MKNNIINYFSLFTSGSTLLCCALPSLFVALGAGASFAGFIGNYPELIWLSNNKLWLFIIAGILLVAAGLMQYKARLMPCPTNPDKDKACNTARIFSLWIYYTSVLLFLTGLFFAYLAPHII